MLKTKISTLMRSKLLLKTIVILITAGTAYGQTNLADNGGFEQGMSTAWSFDAGAGSDVAYSATATSPQEGDSCLQADITTLGENSWSVQIKNGFGPVVEGLVYEASIWAKSATAGSTINFTIGKSTADYTEYGTAYGLALTTDWVKYTVQFTAEVSTSDDITLALHITGEDTYWFDNFSVVEHIEEVIPATVNSYGNKVTIDLGRNLSPFTEDDQLPFFVYSNEREYEIISARLSGDGTIITLVSGERIRKDEVITVEYVPGTMRTSAGVEIEASTYETVNNSTYVYVPPVSAVVTIEDDVFVYPTLVSESITVESNGDLLQDITILNTTGSILSKVPASGYKSNLILSDLNTGAYLIGIKTASGSKIVKVIKK